MAPVVTENPLQVRSGKYGLVFAPDRPFAYLLDAQGTRLAELFYLSGVDSLSGQDDTTAVEGWTVQQQAGHVILSLSAASSVWGNKIYRFRCFEERLEYEIEVGGEGLVTDIHYFGGYSSAFPRWGSGFFLSGQHFNRGFSPEPNTDEQIYFPANQSTWIDLMGVPLPGRGDWFFTPPPFLLAFEQGSNWLGMGIQATPGSHQYTRFGYHGCRDAFHLSLACEGHLHIKDRARLPVVGMDFAQDPYDALQKHVQSAGQQDEAGQVSNRPVPDWWRGPIFCGWGAQCFLAREQHVPAPDLASQINYQVFLRNLAAHDLHPRIVVIDDKWQSEYGTNQVDKQKWPDLPGFIRTRHLDGQKVLLWLKAWDPQGVPVDECIANASGLPIAVDPTHPRFQIRMRQMISHLLSETGLGADGFKIDFSARIPSGPGLHAFGSAWGLELMRAYLELIALAAKTVKPDAMVISHTPHPYLAGAVDMIRLNDINIARPIPPAMRHRARVARLACPQALIDTDNWPMPNKAAWAEYVKLQAELGVPALYFDQGIDSSGERFDDQDYQLIRDCWQSYARSLD